MSDVEREVLAMDEVQTRGGLLPPGDPEGGETAPQTFLELVKQYAGTRVPEPDLVVAIDAIVQLFPSYQFRWK